MKLFFCSHLFFPPPHPPHPHQPRPLLTSQQDTDIDRFELRLGLRAYNKEELERPPYEVRLQEQVNGYLSLGEKPPPNLVAATNCAKIFPKGMGGHMGHGGSTMSTISPGVTLGGRRVGDGDPNKTMMPPSPTPRKSLATGNAGTGTTGTMGTTGTGTETGALQPRVMSASTARSKHRLRHKESVFSTVRGSASFNFVCVTHGLKRRSGLHLV